MTHRVTGSFQPIHCKNSAKPRTNTHLVTLRCIGSKKIDSVLRRIRLLDGIANTETSLLLSTRKPVRRWPAKIASCFILHFLAAAFVRPGTLFFNARKPRLMNISSSYTPPKIWLSDQESGGHFASINRPVAGATHEKALPVGRHPLQLYSMGTPNGVKVTVMLEELLAAGHQGAEYDAWLIRIQDGDQFGSGFVAVNPNSKIPVLMDHSGPVATRVFESGAIMVYLAEKFGAFLPTDSAQRAECLSWLFWQMGSAPFLGGGFGHFYAYAPAKLEYPINRYAMEVKRQLDVLDQRLAQTPYVAGDTYTVADMAIWPWYGALTQGELYEAAEFLQVQSYTHLVRWAEQVGARPAVQRGRMVNRTRGELSSQLLERHDASDFETRTEDKLNPAK